MDVGLMREQRGLLAILVGLSLVAWYVLLQSGPMNDGQMGAAFGADAILFMSIWIVMMVAMMFPAAAPMVLTFARLQARRQSADRSVRTAAFVLGYLAIWSLTGAAAYVLAVGVGALAAASGQMNGTASGIAGGLIIAAGVYQLTPLKRACLSACRSPLGFLMTEWREGVFGAFEIGLRHGLLCLGCCAMLFAALVPLGVMNVALMALVAAFVLVEKALPRGDRVGLVASIALVAGGALLLVSSAIVPMPAGM